MNHIITDKQQFFTRGRGAAKCVKWNFLKVERGPDMDTAPTLFTQPHLLYMTAPPCCPHGTVCRYLVRFRLWDQKVCSHTLAYGENQSFNDSVRRRVWHVPTGQNGQDLIGFRVLWRCEWCRWLRWGQTFLFLAKETEEEVERWSCLLAACVEHEAHSGHK